MVLQEKLVESLKFQRSKWLDDFSEDGFLGHTNLLEISIISLYNRLINLLNVDAEVFRANGAVLALGDFGRSFIGPFQPIPILFLKSEECRLQDEWLDEIINPLKEAGWTVSYNSCTIREVLEKLDKDPEFLKEIISARYISGSRALAEDLESQILKWFENNRHTHLGKLKENWVRRATSLENQDLWLEPDLGSFPGGLEDIRTIKVALSLAGYRGLDDAAINGLIELEDSNVIRHTEKLFIRILNFLLSQKKYDLVLSINIQEEIARAFGYSAIAGFSEVEEFLKDVYRSFFDIQRIARLFWSTIELNYLEKEPSVAGGQTLEPGITVSDRFIEIDPEKYHLTPENFIKIFRLAAQHGVMVGASTLKVLRNSRNILETMAGNRKALDELLQLIHADSTELHVFRQFHDMGFLSCIIPEWKAIIGLTQHDMFHIYPFHEHAIRTLIEVKKILAGDYSREEKDLSAVARKINDPRWLYIAALLHDIGKSGGRDHAIRGGEMVPAIARRLGMLPEESDIVQFLVAEHTLLMDSASMRDIGDEEMLANCTLTIGDQLKLDQLLILTYADLKATGPRAFQKWQQSPIMFLYERLSQILEKGEPSPQLISDRIEQIKTLIRNEVSDLMDEAEVVSQLFEVAPRYLLSVEPQEIARHLRMEWKLLHSDEPFIMDVRKQDNNWIVTIVSEMIPWLLFKSAGLMTLHGIDISAAQVFLKENNIVILIFWCTSRNDMDKKWQEVESDLKRLMEYKLALDCRLSRYFNEHLSSSFTIGKAKSRIVIDNDSSENYSILEVFTDDRPGLLYTITKTLADIGIRVYVAKITTRGNQVADVFYVKDHLGNKLLDSEQLTELKWALKYRLDEAKVNA